MILACAYRKSRSCPPLAVLAYGGHKWYGQRHVAGEQSECVPGVTIRSLNSLLPQLFVFLRDRRLNVPQVSDFLDVTPRLGQNLSDEFVSLQNAEGKLLRVRICWADTILCDTYIHLGLPVDRRASA